jgi:hypothetical protein
MQDESTLVSVKGAIIALASVRQKIRSVKSLAMDGETQKNLAVAAPGNFVLCANGGGSPRAASIFEAAIKNMIHRTAL